MTAAAAINEYRHRRRAEGLCGQAGCKAASGDAYYCEVHAKAHADRQKKRRADAKLERAAAPQ